MSNEFKNYYEVLDISTSASSETIHQGYIRAKNAYSQDSLALYSLMTKEECDDILNLIEEAYSILSEPNNRKEYDHVRGINQNINHHLPSNSAKNSDDPHTLKKNIMAGHNRSMTKIVANKRFDLEYDIDPEFEQKIEQVTEYSGSFLREIREYKKVDIPRLADMTKISKTYLRNIESEEVDKLPALVYARGFVYQYAKCLKLNPDLVATSYIFRLKKLKGEA